MRGVSPPHHRTVGGTGQGVANNERIRTVADEIQSGDVVVWVHHGNRSAGGIGCVAQIIEDKALVVDGALTATVYDWESHDVLEVAVARLGKLDIARYTEEGLFSVP